MDWTHLLAFNLTLLAAMAAPGPALLFALRQSIAGGFATGVATGAGLAQFAFLVATIAEGGGRGHMLAFIDAIPGAETALSQAVAEVLTFSNLDAGVLDVGFFSSGDALADKLAQVGLRFDLPKPEKREVPGAAPGMDPTKPPKLR